MNVVLRRWRGLSPPHQPTEASQLIEKTARGLKHVLFGGCLVTQLQRVRSQQPQDPSAPSPFKPRFRSEAPAPKGGGGQAWGWFWRKE